MCHTMPEKVERSIFSFECEVFNVIIHILFRWWPSILFISLVVNRCVIEKSFCSLITVLNFLLVLMGYTICTMNFAFSCIEKNVCLRFTMPILFSTLIDPRWLHFTQFIWFKRFFLALWKQTIEASYTTYQV